MRRVSSKTLRRLLAEFILIVIGVLSALAVGNWATVQDERNMLGTHTARVRASLGLDGQRLRRWSDIGEVKETGLVALLAELN